MTINKFLKQVVEETGNLTETINPNQQNVDQHSKRPRKMGFTRGKLHNDFRRKKKDRTMIREWEEILITDQRGTSLEWDWATKSSQHHITQIEKKIKVKKWKWRFLFGKPLQLRNQLCMHYSQKKALEISSSSAVKNIIEWWVDTQEWRDGLSSLKSVWKGYSKAQSWLGKTGLDQDWRYRVPPAWLNVRWKDDRTDWWALVPVCLSWLLWFTRIPGFLRCVAPNPRNLLMVGLLWVSLSLS